MKQIRFRDQSGLIRTGRWTPGEQSSELERGQIHFGGEVHDPTEVTVLPPCEPTKIVCVGRNYAKHADERGEDVPDRPLLFLKPPNTVTGHGTDVRLPAGKDSLDYEGELGVVVGEQCRNVSAEDAMDVVAGYTCLVDLSNRDDQDREQNWVRGKAFDGAAPIGPVVAPPSEVPEDAQIEVWVNGEKRQSASREQLIFSIPALIEEITTYLTLEPGDVIATGTPEGVGALSTGDEVVVEVEGVGRLKHTVTVPDP